MAVQGNEKILQEEAMVSSLPGKGRRSIIYWTDSSKSKKDSKGLSKRRGYTKVM